MVPFISINEICGVFFGNSTIIIDYLVTILKKFNFRPFVNAQSYVQSTVDYDP